MTKQERFCELIGAHWSKLRTLFTGVTCYMLTIDMSVIIAKNCNDYVIVFTLHFIFWDFTIHYEEIALTTLAVIVHCA